MALQLTDSGIERTIASCISGRYEVEVFPPSFELPLGADSSYRILATYADETTHDVTTLADVSLSAELSRQRR